MIIQRKPKEFYVVSSLLDLDGSMLEPRHQHAPVPFLEDTTKRIPIYSSVRGAIAAKKATDGEILTVYRVTGIYPSNIIRPSITQSPIAEPLNEYWALSGIQLRKIGDVKVGKVIEKKEIPLGKLQRKYPIEFRRWTDLRPEWQQKKERLYSKMIILRGSLLQRNFNISEDARKYKERKYKGELSKINSELDRQLGKVKMRAIDKASYNKPVKDRSTEVRLIREGNKLGARAFRDPYDFIDESPATVNTRTDEKYIKMKADSPDYVRDELKKADHLPEALKKEFRKIHGDSFKSEYHIKYPKGSGVDTLAHELGHIKSNNPIPGDKRTKKQQYEEEKRASKNAIKMLKEVGLDPKKVNQARRNLERELATYKPAMIGEELENKKIKLKRKFKKI